MKRDDLSTKLIHFTKGTGDTVEEKIITAKKNLHSILKYKCLDGGTGFIKGKFRCICFTEAPIAKLAFILDHPDFGYAPVGVMVEKTWLFKRGGRPVIYQTDSEYDYLHESQRYRHKRYDPNRKIDFSWEREWRICTEKLLLDSNKTTVIVPNRQWVEEFKDEHLSLVKSIQLGSILYGRGYEELTLSQNVKLEWHFIALEDLGVKVKFG